jgi:hypothetical protein
MVNTNRQIYNVLSNLLNELEHGYFSKDDELADYLKGEELLRLRRFVFEPLFKTIGFHMEIISDNPNMSLDINNPQDIPRWTTQINHIKTQMNLLLRYVEDNTDNSDTMEILGLSKQPEES